MQAWHGAILGFDPHADEPHVHFEPDGWLVTAADADGVQRVVAVGPADALRAAYPGAAVTDCRGCLIAPGFIDLHIHYPQTDVIGSPADGLLPWLQRYTFPHEARFADADHAAEVARFFVDELLRHGVTTALAFATSHPGVGGRAADRSERARLALHRGQGAAGPPQPRRRARRDRALAGRHRGADRALARAWAAGVRHHAALCAQLQRCAAAWRG
jgi:cytosine/adenosine deaminase-related metal-dependent hydrolase